MFKTAVFLSAYFISSGFQSGCCCLRSAAAPAKIVFTAGVGRGYQTAVFDMAAGSSKIVSRAPTDSIEPVWLADGRHVICTFRAANTRSLYIVDTESGKATRLSPAAMGNASGASYLAQ